MFGTKQDDTPKTPRPAPQPVPAPAGWRFSDWAAL